MDYFEWFDLTPENINRLKYPDTINFFNQEVLPKLA